MKTITSQLEKEAVCLCVGWDLDHIASRGMWNLKIARMAG